MDSSQLSKIRADLNPVPPGQKQASLRGEAGTGDEGNERRFRDLADRWHKDTRVLSSVTRMAMHPAYQQIIGMGPAAIPLILRDLKETHDHWLWALYAITGVDPAPDGASFDEAVDAWLAWGKSKGYI